MFLIGCGGGGGSSDTPTLTAPSTSSTAVLPTITVAIPSSSYAIGSAELGGWNALQQARVQCGFGALKQNAKLDDAALLHAKYLVNLSVNGTDSLLSHFENVKTDPYYRGLHPWDRTTAQGYGDQVAEILEATVWNYDIGNPPAFPTMEQRGASSMSSLLNTVYHLIGALYDGADVGFGAYMQTAVNGNSRREEYRFGSLNGYQTERIKLGTGNLATFPCEGSSNVPSTFIPANEDPNPFPMMTTASQTVGPPIYLKVDTGQVLTVTASSVSRNGISVATTMLTSANDPQQEIGSNEVFVIPLSPLSPNASYQVNLTGTVGRTPFSRSFTMRTGT